MEGGQGQDDPDLQPHAFKPSASVTLEPSAEPGRRGSLGNLMGKGIVSGMRGKWEQSNPKGASKGSSVMARGKFNPASVSGDRLLFKLTDENPGAKLAIPAQQDDQASTTSSQEPSNTLGSPTPPVPTTPTGKKSPKSAFKRMWGKMTGRSNKQSSPSAVSQSQPVSLMRASGEVLCHSEDALLASDGEEEHGTCVSGMHGEQQQPAMACQSLSQADLDHATVDSQPASSLLGRIAERSSGGGAGAADGGLQYEWDDQEGEESPHDGMGAPGSQPAGDVVSAHAATSDNNMGDAHAADGAVQQAAGETWPSGMVGDQPEAIVRAVEQWITGGSGTCDSPSRDPRDASGSQPCDSPSRDARVSLEETQLAAGSEGGQSGMEAQQLATAAAGSTAGMATAVDMAGAAASAGPAGDNDDLEAAAAALAGTGSVRSSMCEWPAEMDTEAAADQPADAPLQLAGAGEQPDTPLPPQLADPAHGESESAESLEALAGAVDQADTQLRLTGAADEPDATLSLASASEQPAGASPLSATGIADQPDHPPLLVTDSPDRPARRESGPGELSLGGMLTSPSQLDLAAGSPHDQLPAVDLSLSMSTLPTEDSSGSSGSRSAKVSPWGGAMPGSRGSRGARQRAPWDVAEDGSGGRDEQDHGEESYEVVLSPRVMPQPLSYGSHGVELLGASAGDGVVGSGLPWPAVAANGNNLPAVAALDSPTASDAAEPTECEALDGASSAPAEVQASCKASEQSPSALDTDTGDVEEVGLGFGGMGLGDNSGPDSMEVDSMDVDDVPPCGPCDAQPVSTLVANAAPVLAAAATGSSSCATEPPMAEPVSELLMTEPSAGSTAVDVEASTESTVAVAEPSATMAAAVTGPSEPSTELSSVAVSEPSAPVDVLSIESEVLEAVADVASTVSEPPADSAASTAEAPAAAAVAASTESEEELPVAADATDALLQAAADAEDAATVSNPAAMSEEPATGPAATAQARDEPAVTLAATADPAGDSPVRPAAGQVVMPTLARLDIPSPVHSSSLEPSLNPSLNASRNPSLSPSPCPNTGLNYSQTLAFSPLPAVAANRGPAAVAVGALQPEVETAAAAAPAASAVAALQQARAAAALASAALQHKVPTAAGAAALVLSPAASARSPAPPAVTEQPAGSPAASPPAAAGSGAAACGSPGRRPAAAAHPLSHSMAVAQGALASSPMKTAGSNFASELLAALEGIDDAASPGELKGKVAGVARVHVVSDEATAVEGVDDTEPVQETSQDMVGNSASPDQAAQADAWLHAAAHGLMDMDVDDEIMHDGQEQVVPTLPLEGLLDFMPPLEATPSPMASLQASPRVPIQVTRESIPLFVRDSYAVTDSVSLERQSLASIEPYHKGPLAQPAALKSALASSAARRAEVMASTMALGTLREDEAFSGEADVAGSAAMMSGSGMAHHPAGSKAFNARGLARVAASVGFGDAQINDLPCNDTLPDPAELLAMSPMASAREPLLAMSPLAAASPATPTLMVGAGGEAMSGAEARTGYAKASFAMQMDSPTVGLVMPVAAVPAVTPAAATRPGHDNSSVPLAVAKSAIKTPATARRVSGPSAINHGAGTKGPAPPTTAPLNRPNSRLTGATPPSRIASKLPHASPAPTHDATTTTPKSRALSAGNGGATALQQRAAAAAAAGQQQQQRSQSFGGAQAAGPTSGAAVATGAGSAGGAGVTAAVVMAPAYVPPMPTSWATPLAQMQQLPLDFALNAPLFDNSPFPDLDMDTTNIAQEAQRMAQALGGRADSSNGMPSVSPYTPGLNLMSRRTPAPPAAGDTVSLRSAKPRRNSALGLPGRTPSSAGGAGPGGLMRESSAGFYVTPTASAGGHGHPSTSAAGYLMTPNTSTGGAGSHGMSHAAAGFLEAQNLALMDKLVAAEQRAVAAEQQVEQLRDQIQTMSFGDMLQAGAGDMEREARLCAEEQLQAATSQIASLQHAMHAVKAEMQAQLADVEKVHAASIRDLKAELSSKDAELVAGREALAFANGQVAQAKEQHLESQRMLVAGQAEIKALQNQLSAAARDVQRLRGQRDELQGSLKRSVDDLTAEQLRGKHNLAESAKQATALHASLTKYKGDREALKKQAAEVQASMQAMQGEREAHMAEISKLRNENGQMMLMLEELIAQKEMEKAGKAHAK